MVNVDDETSQFTTIFGIYVMSSLTIEGENNICTEYFDTSNNRTYLKRTLKKIKR